MLSNLQPIKFVLQFMKGIKKTDLKWLKGLMLSCQVLLVLFTAQWLYSQYSEQQAELKKDLSKLFNDVQHKITDSLLLNNIDPSLVNRSYLTTEANTSRGSQNAISPAALHNILSKMRPSLSSVEEKKLFRMDTIVFNEMFTSEMRHQGWNFNSRWINSSDSDKKGTAAIFIASNFFTNANGVVVNNYWWFLFLKLLPQILFVAILLFLTATAFYITFRNLKAQINLGHMKDDFISNMSHELKTPIATVKVALEALNTFNIIDDPKKGREYLSMATAEMDRLELLATRVLNTSLLETGNIYLQQESYELDKLVQEVIQSMQLRVKQFGASLSYKTTGNNFRIPMDKLHMQGVLVNLIDNSLKYGDKPVHIDIQLSELNGSVRLELIDNGPGIPEEYKERIFEKFFRVPTGNRHNIKGHGLGLSYAAQVMRQHSGNISVNNVATGGCMFTLTF
jgi:signal transduction histidine kinase